jgi:hypothetical protein
VPEQTHRQFIVLLKLNQKICLNLSARRRSKTYSPTKKKQNHGETKKVKLKQIEVGDLVLLRSPQTETIGKLEPKWTGPFVVMEKTRP